MHTLRPCLVVFVLLFFFFNMDSADLAQVLFLVRQALSPEPPNLFFKTAERWGGV